MIPVVVGVCLSVGASSQSGETEQKTKNMSQSEITGLSVLFHPLEWVVFRYKPVLHTFNRGKWFGELDVCSRR